jgi:hypothetical protein
MTDQDRVQSVASHGFTSRQAAFLTLVMRHAGVCVQRQYCAFADITYGQVSREFFEKLVARRFATPYACGRRGAQLFHIHHKALYRAIGEADSRLRRRGTVTRAIERLMLLDAVLATSHVRWLASEPEKVAYCVHERGLSADELPALTFEAAGSRTVRYFPDKLPIGLLDANNQVTLLYVATEQTGGAFRSFLDRHERLLQRLTRWRVLLVLPRGQTLAEASHRRVITEFCAAPLRPAVVDEFQWFCGVRRQLERAEIGSRSFDSARYARARRAFGAPRLYAAYRRWCREGDGGLQCLLSGALNSAQQRGTAVFETLVLPHVYGELGPLVQTA